MTKVLYIEGMNCKHCLMRVENALKALDGIKVKVNLKKGTAKVSSKEELSNQVLIDAVKEAGYTVTEIE